MVGSGKIQEKLQELSVFFSSVTESEGSSVDKDSALYGLEKIRNINYLLDKYKKTPKNIYLKQIHSSFSSVTRGIEAFTDNEANDIFIKKCEGIYDIVKELEAKIKW
jgi:hypothetical protein